MESNLPLFSLPFVDSYVFSKNKVQGLHDDLHGTLPSHVSLLGAVEDLAQFLTADGPLEEPDLNGPTILHCEICKKQFDNAKKYYGHLRVHSKDNLWICDKCPGQKFSTKQQLMKHSLTHKPLERVWRCPQCPLAFEALFRLQQHLFAKHLDYRPHKCDECGKTFHKLSDLKKHKSVHTNTKSHPCLECGVCFKDKSNLKRHMLCHSQEKPFVCVGCGTKYKQLANMRRHSQKCQLFKNHSKSTIGNTTRKNYCRVCGMTFQYKSALLEHCVRQHTGSTTNEPEKDVKTKEINVDTNRTVDNIVDDILSAEDDYMTMTTQNDVLNPYNNQTQNNTDHNNLTTDNSMQTELLKVINQLHTLDDESFYNNIDFDSFQTSHIFNTDANEIDYSGHDRNNTNTLFDYNIDHQISDTDKNIDHDIMNALYHVKAEQLPDELLNVHEINPAPETKAERLLQNPTVTVNECATIFESDVDLEASTSLAANLNQLIGENSVQYISTEDDDTFIISLNSEIDAEQLTDMLNIGAELVDVNKKAEEEKRPVPSNIGSTSTISTSRIEPFVVKQVEEPAAKIKKESHKNDENILDRCQNIVVAEKFKKSLHFVCRKCNKVFEKKDNYISHKATREPSLHRHKCSVCKELFSDRSTLNRHFAKEHEPTILPSASCHLCNKQFAATWMVKVHIERDHDKLFRYICDKKDSDQKFYKNSDIIIHQRYHGGDRPYVYDICSRALTHQSHLHKNVTTEVEKRSETSNIESSSTHSASLKEPIVVKFKDEPVVAKIKEDSNKCKENIIDCTQNKAVKEKMKKQQNFVCRKCNKVFMKKDNYMSHKATHEPSLRRHKCSVCRELFSYRSTLNKHFAKEHEPRILPSVSCHLCNKQYAAAWMVKVHIERDHDKILRYVCDKKDCNQKFYKKSDLVIHQRYHAGDRPYVCNICSRAFTHQSHLNRHIRTVDCTKFVKIKTEGS